MQTRTFHRFWFCSPIRRGCWLHVSCRKKNNSSRRAACDWRVTQDETRVVCNSIAEKNVVSPFLLSTRKFTSDKSLHLLYLNPFLSFFIAKQSFSSSRVCVWHLSLFPCLLLERKRGEERDWRVEEIENWKDIPSLVYPPVENRTKNFGSQQKIHERSFFDWTFYPTLCCCICDPPINRLRRR